MAIPKTISVNSKKPTLDEQGLYSYAQEKLGAAMIKLATGERDIKSRLKSVYDSELCGLTIKNFPDELKEDWQKIMQELTKLGPRSINGTSIIIHPLNNTLGSIRLATGAKIAEKICDLKYKIDTYFEYLQTR